ncbi:ABC transporter substrate-binding protein [Pseudonocardia sp. TRM90224]|uniref:ABC transporter substrate-binding protein n=1 Tax=Pseudonocardia sp. TRM90224 TaxID=2812678 RepID=UPI001E3F5F02|nr:ABC transporter substrate-binding protein [Pseudonocardia sp. TRM90224]
MASRRAGRTTRTLTSALLVGALALLTACAGTGATEPTGAPAARFTLGFSAWPGWFPWQVAAEQGLFAKHGIDVDLRYFDSYTDSINALAAGVIDGNSQTLNDTLSSVSGGARLSVVLVNDNSTGNDKIIARDGIKDISDLRGQKVAVEQGAVDHYLLQLALAESNMTDNDIELTPMLTDAAAAAFVAGQVDAVAAFAPFTSTALQRPGSRAIATSAEFPGAIPDHLVVSAAVRDARPDDVQALVDTWFDTLRWIKENPEPAIEIMARRAGVSTADYRTYDNGTTIFTRQQNIEASPPAPRPPT